MHTTLSAIDLCIAVQIAAAHNLREEVKKGVEGRAKLGVEAFAEALLGIPKILAENCGFDAQVLSPLSLLVCDPGGRDTANLHVCLKLG